MLSTYRETLTARPVNVDGLLLAPHRLTLKALGEAKIHHGLLSSIGLLAVPGVEPVGDANHPLGPTP